MSHQFALPLQQINRLSSLCAFANGKVNPIYEQILVEYSDVEHTVTLTSSNSNQFTKLTIDILGGVVGTGSFCVSAKRLGSVLTALTGDEALFKFNNKDELHVSAKRTRLKVQTFDAKCYPASPEMETPVSRINAKIGDLMLAINKSGYCVANGDVRTYLNYIYLKVCDNSVMLCCTDGFRLSRFVSHAINHTQGIGEYLIPPVFFQIIQSKKFAENTECKLQFTNQRVELKCENITVISTLGDGNFPDINRVIPEQKKAVVMSLDEFSDTVKRIASFAILEKIPAISLNFYNNECHIKVKGTANELTDIVEIQEYSSDIDAETAYSFNVNYLIQAVNQQAGDTVTLWLGDNGQATTIASSLGELTTLVMPVRI